MKKIFSLFAAVLFAGSMMAGNVIFSASDFVGGTKDVGSAFSVTKEGVTVSSNKAYGTGEELRIYAGGKLTVEADVKITKISAEFGKNTKATFNPAEPNATSWSINAEKQFRITTLTVTVDKETAGGDTIPTPKPEDQPQNLGPKTVAEFLSLKNTKDTCVLTGVVSNITNTTYGNFDLTDATGKVLVYGLLTPDGQAKQFATLGVVAGDTVTIKAVYYVYKNTPEAKDAVFVSVAQKPRQTINITIHKDVRLTDAVESAGWWQVLADSAQYSVWICSNESATAVAGTYTFADLDPDYTGMSIVNGNDTTDVAFVSGSITVTENDAKTQYSFIGSFVADNGNIYNIDLLFVKPQAQTTKIVNVPQAQLDDEYFDYGLFAVAGYTADDSIYVQFGLWAEDGIRDIDGDYTQDDFDYSYLGTAIYEGDEEVEIYTATIKIVANVNSYKVTADVLGYNNVLYKITMTIPSSTQGIENNSINGKALKSLKNGIVVIEKNEVKYNVLGTIIR